MADTGYRNRTGFELRPALPSDAPAMAALSLEVFGPGVDRSPQIVRARAEHLLAGADPSSAVAETANGTLIGHALTRRIGPIVLLAWAVVREAEQGRGVMRALLAEFPAAEPGVQRVILSSTDPKAMRRYAALGLRLHPTVSAGGILRPGAVEMPSASDAEAGDASAVPTSGSVATSPRRRDIVECSPLDAAPILDALAFEVRGAPYGRDIALLESQGDRVHLAGDDAAVVRNGGVIRLAVARDEHSASLALRAALASAPPGATIHLNQLRAGMDWAVRVASDAGLALSPEGPVFSDQPLSPLHLPQGSLC